MTTFKLKAEKITSLDGTPPKRFVVNGFDSVEKAEAWYRSAVQQEVESLRKHPTDSREFIVEGLSE